MFVFFVNRTWTFSIKNFAYRARFFSQSFLLSFKIKSNGVGHFQRGCGDENLKINFMWPNHSTYCGTMFSSSELKAHVSFSDCLSFVRPYVCKLFTFLHNHWANFNQTWQKNILNSLAPSFKNCTLLQHQAILALKQAFNSIYTEKNKLKNLL